MLATTQSDTTNSLRMGHQYRQYLRPVPSSAEGTVRIRCRKALEGSRWPTFW